MQTKEVRKLGGQVPVYGETRDWSITKIPQFKDKKALVLAGAFCGGVKALMAEAGFAKAEGVDDADVIVFTGGADISPELYGEKNVKSYPDPARDKFEKAVYEHALRQNKMMFGICRGAQFLHAMNKDSKGNPGKLWQHVEGHGRTHMFVDIEENVRLKTSSMHHQMLIAHDNMTIIGVCEDQISTTFIGADLSINLMRNGGNAFAELEIEAACYPETRCFVTQGHPEVGPPEYAAWCMTKLHDFYYDWEGVNSTENTEHLHNHLKNIGSIH